MLGTVEINKSEYDNLREKAQELTYLESTLERNPQVFFVDAVTFQGKRCGWRLAERTKEEVANLEIVELEKKLRYANLKIETLQATHAAALVARKRYRFL
tara:strand:+ start:137 stop:436 length:300 start_codon:yes stop_codon:yes gene_type:complete